MRSLPVARSLPVDWAVTAGGTFTSGSLGTSCDVTSGGLGSHFRGTAEQLQEGSRDPVML